MFDVASFLAQWLADMHILSCALLGAALAAVFALRQPARRMALARSMLLALVALAGLCALPGWSAVHLLDAKPQAARPAAVERVDVAPMKQSVHQLIPTIDVDRIAPEARPRETVIAKLADVAGPQSASFDWRVALVVGQAIGSVVVIGWLAVGAAFARRLRRCALAVAAELQDLLKATAIGAPAPELLSSAEIETPVALGWRRPAIILPANLTHAADGAISSTLAHEWAHIANGDLRTLAASRWLLVLMWPQPLYWVLRRVIRMDQETLADAAAAERTGRVEYAEQLMGWARVGGPRGRASRLAGSVGLWEGPSQLKRRIAALVDERLTVLLTCSRRWRIGSALVALAAAGLLSLATLERQQAAAQDDATEAPTGESAEAAAPAVVDAEATVSERDVPAWARAEPNVVKGRALDELGQPLAGVDVTLYVYDMGTDGSESQRIATQTTDDEGVFRFDDAIDVVQVFPGGLPDERFPAQPIRAIAIVGRAEERAPAWRNEMAASVVRSGHVGQVTLKPAATLRGRVLGPDGRPVEGAKLTAGLGGLPGIDLYSATTDAEGRYEIDDVSGYDAAESQRQLEEFLAANPDASASMSSYARRNPLLVQHPDFATRRVDIRTIPGELDVELQLGAAIAGVAMLRGSDGTTRPAADLAIQLTRQLPEPALGEAVDPWAYQTASVRTNGEGRYRLASLPEGKYALSANIAGWVTLGVQGVEAAAGETVEAPELALTRGGTVRIKLVDAATGEALAIPNGTRGWVNPSRRPPLPLGVFALRPNVVTFNDASAEVQLPAGDYVIVVNLPGATVMEPFWQSTNAKAFGTAEAHTVVEGETSELIVEMEKFTQPQPAVATGAWSLVPIGSLPEAGDEAEEDVDAPAATSNFVPAVEPADGAP